MSLTSHNATPDFNGSASHDLPAIAGGAPAKTAPYGKRPRYGADELRELEEALDQETLFYSQGHKVTLLEEEFATKNGARFAVATSSGTASIHAALLAAGISPDDEVITSPITDMGTASPILFQGAVPIFADLDPHGYNLQTASVEALITPKTRAVVAVQLWGNTCEMNSLRALCDNHDIWLIEDCSQAFGATYDGKPVGTIGHMGCFSFNEFKHISCGDGGLVITDDPNLAIKLRLATDKCYDRRADAVIRQPHFLAPNYRMTELQGAVARAQLRKLDDIVARRREWAADLTARIENAPGIAVPRADPHCDPTWWFYMLRVDPEVLGADADEFARALKAEGVPAAPHYIAQCLYEYPIFVNHSAFERGQHAYDNYEYKKGLCPNAEAILDTCIKFPVNEGFTEQDGEETAHAINRVAQWFASKKA